MGYSIRFALGGVEHFLCVGIGDGIGKGAGSLGGHRVARLQLCVLIFPLDGLSVRLWGWSYREVWLVLEFEVHSIQCFSSVFEPI